MKKKKDEVYLICTMPDRRTWWEKLLRKPADNITRVTMGRADAMDFLDKVNANPSNYLTYDWEEIEK